MDATLRRSLVAINRSTNESKPIVIEIGGPIEDANGDFKCPVAIIGFYDQIIDIHGVDEIDATKLAIAYSEKILRSKKQNWEIQWTDGSEFE